MFHLSDSFSFSSSVQNYEPSSTESVGSFSFSSSSSQDLQPSPSSSPVLMASSSFSSRMLTKMRDEEEEEEEFALQAMEEEEEEERFTSIHILHQTLFGHLARAWDHKTQRVVALKKAWKQYGNTRTAQVVNVPVAESLHAERQAMELMQRPCVFPCTQEFVAQCIERGKSFVCIATEMVEEDDAVTFVMPFVEGMDLHERIIGNSKEVQWMTEDEARPLLFQLACAIAFLHSRGVAHRDLSLENVMLATRVSEGNSSEGNSSISDEKPSSSSVVSSSSSSSSPHIFVVDFGVSCVHPLASMCRMAVSDSQLPVLPCTALPDQPLPGKEMYLAPEVRVGATYNAFGCDMFSFGIIMYCMLTGRAPFGNSRDKWAHNMCTGKFVHHGTRCKCTCHTSSSLVFQPPALETQWSEAQAIYRTHHLTKRHSCRYETCFHHERHGHLSPHALDLLSRLFAPAERRINSYQLLSHPWFQIHTSLS